MQMIFEDNRDAVLSKFLCKAYGYDNADDCKKIIFCNGNRNIINTIETYCQKNEGYIIFVDVVPDNFKTINTYKEVEQYCLDRPNLFVIPIPCIEYFVIKVWGDLNTKSVSEVFIGHHVRDTELTKKQLRGVYKSFESYCKMVLEHCLLPCQKSKGRFYTEDCICSHRLYKVKCESISTQNKAIKLVTELPIYIYLDSDKDTGYKISLDDLTTIKESCIQLYYEIARDFKDNGYIYEIIKLNEHDKQI